jgi:hypothetical protein
MAAALIDHLGAAVQRLSSTCTLPCGGVMMTGWRQARW